MIVDAFKILTEEDAAEYDADNMNEKIININDKRFGLYRICRRIRRN